MLYKYARKYDNIKVISQRHKGVSAARNLGIANATGRYLSFIDGDDSIAPNMVEYLIKRCAEYDLDACFFDYVMVDSSTTKELNCPYYFSKHLNNYVFEKVISPRDVKFTVLNNSMATGIYRRSIFIDEDLCFNESLTNGEDCVLKFDSLKLFKKIMFVNKIFYTYYRNRKNSATQSISSDIGRLFPFMD